MKKTTIKKYARELYNSMGIIGKVEKVGQYNNVWYDWTDIKGAKDISGKRLRKLCRPEVIAYFNAHEGVKLIIDGGFFSRARTYKIYADHNYCCGSGEDVEIAISRKY